MRSEARVMLLFHHGDQAKKGMLYMYSRRNRAGDQVIIASEWPLGNHMWTYQNGSLDLEILEILKGTFELFQ